MLTLERAKELLNAQVTLTISYAQNECGCPKDK